MRLLLLLLLFPSVTFAQKITFPKGDLPVSGKENTDLAPLDELMRKFVQDNQIPGASFAVSRKGKIVYSRGFGYADLESKSAVQPDSLFRIASVSKPITAVAILHLIEGGKLKLDDPAFSKLKYKPFLEKGAKVDPRLKDVTVRQLLHHTGGWDRDKSFDPMFRSTKIASTLGVKAPAGPVDVIRYMMGQPLDFTPGERVNYSNFGYCVLGRLIEEISGKTYEDYVRTEVLSKLGITTMRVGKSLKAEKRKGEVTYYDLESHLTTSVFDGSKVPSEYGGWYLEAMDSHGGWVASASDLVQFAADLDDPKQSKLLSEESFASMVARPEGNLGKNKEGKPKTTWYGCGWNLRDVGNGKMNLWHSGSLPGTNALLVRRGDGFCWAVLFNRRNELDKEDLIGKIDPLIHGAVDQVKKWP